MNLDALDHNTKERSEAEEKERARVYELETKLMIAATIAGFSSTK